MAIQTKDVEALSLEEAMANLALMVSIDLEDPPSLALLSRKRFAIGEKRGTSVQWLSSEGEGPVVEVVDATYQLIYSHLQSLLVKEVLEEGGVAPIMALVSESAQQMEAYLTSRMGHPLQKSLTELTTYKELKKFYRDWMAAKKEETQEMESIRRDQDYELFIIRKENGRPYFDIDLLRHVKMVCGFEGGGLEEDPLLRIRSLVDRDLQASAQQILLESHSWVQKYYKLPKEVKQHSLARHLSKALIALFLASNPHNLIQNTSGKSSFQYFEDFHHFLRDSLHTDSYQKWITYPSDTWQESNVCMHLVHILCHSLFYRLGGVKQEVMGLIHRMVHKGAQEGPAMTSSSIENRLLIEDQSLRTVLLDFPNGPLFKILDQIRTGEMGFDPIGQDNRPSRVYQMKRKGRHIDILRLPSPTQQVEMGQVVVVEEFLGFLRALAENEGKHILINLQDRTSWKEEARALALEALSKNAEYSKQLVVVTVPKAGEFYHQVGPYLNQDRADSFFTAFKKELKKPDSSWFFSHSISRADLMDFIDQALLAIHSHFFHQAKELSRQEREEFIEIVYQFLVLYLIDHEAPTSVSFTCKDGVDTGAAASAIFFAFLKSLTGQEIHHKEDLDLFRFLIYSPALLVRERAVDAERFYRVLPLLSRWSEDITLVFQKMKMFFSKDFLKTLSVLSFLHSLK